MLGVGIYQRVFKFGLMAFLIVAASLFAVPGYAQTQMAEGEIRRLDPQNAKVTIRHGEIKSLDMPPMTMVFVAKPKSLLDGLKVGDKIQFSAIEENSQYVVTAIKKAAN
ncbi:MAG: copper-binding protein [Burkholderiaceae bacterium]|nr:copper-binding protein [Burkholderiaceae bacterium]MCD8515765.1 copper-binding protein [Burkholderiaceae bacterium]MCD8537508.1 copper-binding protein [Burkholderiaceae bacterium]MCD8565457.1 copper-binding protein [Burkholderiaceae bacterium]